MATKNKTLRIVITTPQGDKHVVPVKPSSLIALEERYAMPILQRISEGYTGALARLGYVVALGAGDIIPDGMTFEEFVDGDDLWTIDWISPEEDVAVEDAEGNA
jgi:hypothetical protein